MVLGLRPRLGPRLGRLVGPLGPHVADGSRDPVSFHQYGATVPVLDLAKVARLHGFASPDSAVEWAKECRRAKREASLGEQWPLEGGWLPGAAEAANYADSA